MTDTVAVAAVTFDRPEDVRTLLGALSQQTHTPHAIALVDSGTEAVGSIAAEAPAEVTYVRSLANLGGAGGFSLAILNAIASGARLGVDHGRRRPSRRSRMPGHAAGRRQGPRAWTLWCP